MAPRSIDLATETGSSARVFIPVNRFEPQRKTLEPIPERSPLSDLPRTRLVKFLCESPSAAIVAIAGTFTDWQPRAMFQDVTGVWGIALQLTPGEYEYRLMIDGVWGTDPSNPRKAVNRYGAANSVLVVH